MTKPRDSDARFFLDGNFAAGETVTISGEDAHRIQNVLRLRIGDTVAICDSGATVYRAQILDFARDLVTLRLTAVVQTARPATENALSVTLAQCLPKAAKMDYVVEKATELGVDRIIPVQSERVIGERGSSSHKIERWRRIARSAAEQSRAAEIPLVDDPVTWPQLLDEMKRHALTLVAWEVEPLSRRAFDSLFANVKSVLIVIGPEGGLSHAEVDEARAAGATVVSLGRKILRTETAGLVAVALARYAAGDL